MERKNKSPVWRVFIKDAAHKRTVCTQCGKEFKYRYTTTNLRDHLKRYHPEWLPDTSANSTSTDSQVVPYASETQNICVEVRNSSGLESISEDEPGRKNKSPVWQVFVKDADCKNVTCTLCQKEFKFWNNTTNLRAHLSRSHPNWDPEPRVSFNESGDEIEYDGEQLSIEGRRSSTSSSSSVTLGNIDTSFPRKDSYVWRVFVQGEPRKGVFCTLCQKDFITLNTSREMIDHLRRLHPDWDTTSANINKDSDPEYDEADDKGPSEDSTAPMKSVFLVNSDRKNRSPVWEVFLKDPERKRTICMICKKDFKCWNNTANLLDHLRRIHPDWKPGSGVGDAKIDDNLVSKRPLIARIRNSTSVDNEDCDIKPTSTYLESYSNSVVTEMKSKRLDKLIGEMICLDFQKLSLVEDTGFKKLLKELIPSYNVPNHKTIIKETLPQIYENVSKCIRQDLLKCKYVAVSIELWTNLNMEAFLTISVHYFANDKFTSSVLQTERIPPEHSSEDLASVMHKIMDHWRIFDKITAIVAEEDEAIKAACNLLNITHIPCIAHTLNSIITEVLTENDDAQMLLQRCQNLGLHFKLNSSATDILHDIQSQMGQPILGLKQVAPTRWTSALHMFQRLVEMKEPLTTTLVAMPEGPEPLATSDWLNLDDFILVLKPFELMTSELSADSYCNISKVVPLVRGVQSSLQNITCASDLGVALKKTLLAKLEARFSTYEKYVIPSVATLLDPRFKRAGLGVDTAIETTRTFVIEQLSEVKNSSSAANEKSKKGDETSSLNNSDIWNFLDEKVSELTSHKGPISPAEVTVTQYLELPYLKRHECPFKFWLSQSTLEPELSDIAMKFMCIPATSFPAERLYSKMGIDLNERRNRITTKHFNTLIFLNRNLK